MKSPIAALALFGTLAASPAWAQTQTQTPLSGATPAVLAAVPCTSGAAECARTRRQAGDTAPAGACRT